ncbi:hypothetical protein [Delftia sp. zbq_16]|uniref:hypothetical protein n=1 Tax=Delftia sp. zbq_16 TaxID=3414429 RepID=UPI003C2B36D8
MADTTTSEQPGTTTIVVQVQPAPASSENVDKYTDVFWAFFGILVVLMGWKKVQSIFDNPYDN